MNLPDDRSAERLWRKLKEFDETVAATVRLHWDRMNRMQSAINMLTALSAFLILSMICLIAFVETHRI